MAKPSMAELENGGTSNPASTDVANTLPRASGNGTSSPGSGTHCDRISSRASSILIIRESPHRSVLIYLTAYTHLIKITLLQ